MADKKITELDLATPEETDVIPFVDISDTTMGLSGTTKKATKADLKGAKGDPATVDAGTTTTLNAGESATVTNVGTTSDAIFNFGIPKGDKGDAGACVESVAFVGDDIVFTLDDASTVTLVGAKTSLKGDTGAQVESVAFAGDDMVFTLDDASTATLVGAKTDLKGDTGEAGDDAYVYIAYASDDTGTDFTTTFNPLLDYIAIKNTTTAIVTPQASDFTGLWKNYKGAKGDKGDIGVDWQGAWSAGTYTANQAVSHNGSSWIATTTTTEEPSISATDWDLIALKGTDGAGSGDVLGPATNTANYIPQWDGANSKTLKDGLGLDTDLSSVSANDDTVPSAKATKAMGDLKLEIASKATQAEVATGTDNDKYVTPLAVAPYANNSLYRQAIINGNFDVWQRGTSFTIADNTGAYTADRFYLYNLVSGQNYIGSRVEITDLPGSNYALQTSWSASTATFERQRIGYTLENIDAKKLAGKNVVLTLYVKSKQGLNQFVVNARYNNTGARVAYSDTLIIATSALTINTSTWTKIILPFTVPDLATLTSTGTFGFDMYGRNTAGENTNDGVQIAQVQLCAGIADLPFQPKSYAEELRDCQRYYQTRVVRTINGIMNYGLPEDLRTTPTTATASAGTIANATSNGYQITHNANADSTVVLSAEL